MERRKNRLKRERQKRKFPASEQAIDIIKRPFRLNRLLCILGSVIFLKMGHSWTLFLLFSSFQYNTVYNKLKFAGVWIPTEDLWYWKQLLCQLSHNHCSRGYSYILMWSLRHLPDKVDPYTRVGTIWTNWQRAIGRYLGMRWRLVSAKVVSCCVHVKPKKIVAHARQHFIPVWLVVSQSSCSSPSLENFLKPICLVKKIQAANSFGKVVNFHII